MTDGERSKTVYISVFAAMITSVATTYGLRALDAPDGEIEGTVEVPAVLGLETETARELIVSRGLRMVVRAEEPSDEHPAGRVSSQEPLAGSEIPADTAVNVVISTGMPKVTVPSLTGQTLADARARLESLGLRVGSVTEGGEGPPGTVTSLDPATGSEVDSGAEINIVATAAGVEIPDVVGTNYRRVREQLTQLGLTTRIRRRYDESRPDFVVLSIEPAAGERVPPGSEVTLTIND